jgi:hypothetical protein
MNGKDPSAEILVVVMLGGHPSIHIDNDKQDATTSRRTTTPVYHHE